MSNKLNMNVHPVIWLEPWCDTCEIAAATSENSGRQWCQDEVWGHCTQCGAAPIKYELSLCQPRLASAITDE